MRSDWTKIRKIKGGHGYWRHKSGAIAITDDSGTYPEDCEPVDDPPLFLDRSRAIRVGERGFTVPLKHSNNRTSGTPASGEEALWVATTFDMRLEIQLPSTTQRYAVIPVPPDESMSVEKAKATLEALEGKT